MDQRVQWSGHRRGDRPWRGRLARLPWLPVAALASAAAMAAAAPLTSLDDRARAWVLSGSAAPLPPDSARQAPSEAVMVVEASAADLEADRCSRLLGEALVRGHARGAWLLPPTDVFCGKGLGPRATPLTRASLRIDGGGAVVGLTAPSPAAGVEAARWVVPASAVPSIALGDLGAGKLPASVLDGRVVVVGMDDALGGAPATLVAEMLGGLLTGGARAEAPPWVCGALGAAVAGLVLLAHRLPARFAAPAVAVLLAALVAGQILAARLGLALLPPASLLLGVTAAAALPPARAALRWRSARRAARERAAEAGVRAPPPEVDLPGALAELAAEAYPADLVLVGELPQGEWILRLDDARVAEEGRDVRRPPYATRDGVPVTQVSRSFLAGGEPAVIVPMVALGALEGYLFLCGAQAEQAHLADPERATHLADELALMVRGRRIERADAAPEAPSELAAFLHDAPAALLYADAQGSVRLLSRAFAVSLRARGAVRADGQLDAGTLTLTEVLVRLTGQSHDEATAAVMAALTRADGASFPVNIDGVPHALSLRGVRRRRRGNSWSTGFAAALVDARARAVSNAHASEPARVTMVSGAVPRAAPTVSGLRPPRLPSFSSIDDTGQAPPEATWEEPVTPWPIEPGPRYLEGRAGASCAVPTPLAVRATGSGDGAASGRKTRARTGGESAKDG